MKKFFLLAAGFQLAASCSFAIINGTAVDPAKFPQIVSIGAHGSKCSAAIIGSRVLVTVAHCVYTGAVVPFTVGRRSYEAKMERSPQFPAVPHDIALGLVSQPIADIVPLSVGRTPVAIGDSMQLAGWGCVAAPGNSGSGTLRFGRSAVSAMTTLDFLMRAEPNGGALCWGDSGGPVLAGPAMALVGIGSKGDLRERSIAIRFDSKETELFVDDFIQRHRVEICGVNAPCRPLDLENKEIP